MDWVTPQYSHSEVDRAGRVLVSREGGDLSQALQVIGNWRASHIPRLLDAFDRATVNLKQRASGVKRGFAGESYLWGS